MNEANEGVFIRGLFVSFAELEADVKAAVNNGYSGEFAFTPETVSALLEYIKESNNEEN